jgi:uncharacterized membrane protein YdbT with pleckstrin-like domain
VSPAGYSEDSGDPMSARKPLVLRPAIKKTLIKGAIAIGAFSLFLNIASNLVNYLIFLGLAFGLLGLFMLYKWESKFLISEDNVVIKRALGKERTINYRQILDMSVAQGMLARRFNCGSLFMILKEGRGGVNMMGGGVAERMEDIPDPNYIYELISSRLGPYSV